MTEQEHWQELQRIARENNPKLQLKAARRIRREARRQVKRVEKQSAMSKILALTVAGNDGLCPQKALFDAKQAQFAPDLHRRSRKRMAKRLAKFKVFKENVAYQVDAATWK